MSISLQKELKAVANAQRDLPVFPKILELPVDAKEHDLTMVFFQGILSSREFDFWTEYRVHLAAKLATTMMRIERVESEIEDDGYTAVGGNGQITKHPRVIMLEIYLKERLNLSRQLGLNTDNTKLGTSNSQTMHARETKVRSSFAVVDVDDNGFFKDMPK